MKAIYDISVLGMGFYVPRARTGIFRVVENLAQELVKARVVGALSSTLSVGSYFDCLDYLQSNTALAGTPLLRPGVSKGILKAFHGLHERIHSDSLTSFPTRVVRRLANNRIVTKSFAGHILGPADLANAAIYHSPFYPIPEQIRKLRHIRKIITVHDLIPLLHPQFFQYDESALIRRVVESIDDDTWVTCVSHATKSDLCNYLPSLDPSRVFVTHLAASSQFYPCSDQARLEHVREKFGIHDRPYVLSLSTLEPRKNIIQTIRCFARLIEQENVTNLLLVLVGTKGWDFDPIFDEIAASPKIRDRIIVTGYAADEDLAPLYTGATMFVYPSFYEGFGLPPLEAMQCGVPVITSNTSSLPEVIGNAGIMVPPEDGDALSQAMLTIYNSDELRKTMAANALSQSTKFSWEKCASQTIDAYKAATASASHEERL